MEIEKAQCEFLKKMNKRFPDLDKELYGANKIVLICNRTDTIEKLRLF